ncbi:iron-siderophore ABC transporter substrate-binding protein [Kitasatospora sp. NPDC002040]|uniref:iron-siderophore ABC transporter substrate-binding protein n=1 Tax=Kitasatospora sp. NPDC002040 TaxID=3154661 RepID=UPI00332166F7
MPRQFSRRTTLAGLGAALLAGCTSSPALPAAPELPTGTELPSPAPVPSTTVTTATGEVAVPGAPSRVVVLDTAELDSAFTLGVPPVGAARAAADPGLPDYWPASWLARVGGVGVIGNPDTGLIAALAPDLILGNRTRDGDRYDALRAIAPTVLTETTGYPWKDDFQLHAQALGRRRQAAAVTAEYERHVGRATRAIGDAGSGGRRISVVRFVEGSPTVRLYGRQSFIGSLLTDLGLGRPDPQNVDRFAVEVPPDRIAQADGDLLLYSTYGNPARALTDAVLAGPGWQGLGAVKAHRAFPVDDQLWFEGIGYTGANLILAELQRFLGA